MRARRLPSIHASVRRRAGSAVWPKPAARGDALMRIRSACRAGGGRQAAGASRWAMLHSRPLPEPGPMHRSIAALAPHLLSVLRIVSGLLFLEHGMSKFLGFPVVPALPPAFSMGWWAGTI